MKYVQILVVTIIDVSENPDFSLHIKKTESITAAKNVPAIYKIRINGVKKRVHKLKLMLSVPEFPFYVRLSIDKTQNNIDFHGHSSLYV